MKYFDPAVRIDEAEFPHLVLMGNNYRSAEPWLNKLDKTEWRYFHAHRRYHRVKDNRDIIVFAGNAVVFRDPHKALYAKLKWGQAEL